MGSGEGEKKVFLDMIREGDQVSDCFLLARKTLAETRNGKPYLSLTLMDRTGEMEGRVWERARELDQLAAAGDVVRVRGVATSFQNRVQLKVSSLELIPGDRVRMSDFMPASRRDPDEMRAELAALIRRMDDPALRALMERIFSGQLLEEFCTAPAAKKMHHACIHGLLEHTLSVAGLALRLADHYPDLDRDLLLAGALTHDIAKTREFSYQAPPFDYTHSGRLLGHLVLGVDMIREAAAGVADLPPERLDELLHLVLSHHGRHEFGAPVLPMTPEAILLHHIDDMDAKMDYMRRLRAGMDGDNGWTDYQRPLERFLYFRPGQTPVRQEPAEEPGRDGPDCSPGRKKPVPAADRPQADPAPSQVDPESLQLSLFGLKREDDR